MVSYEGRFIEKINAWRILKVGFYYVNFKLL
jgi:hypothetical protein